MTARLPDLEPNPLRPSRLSHLVLQTPRYREMVAWYKTFLGAEPMFENEVVSFLTYDDEHHRIMIGNNPNVTPRDPKAAGVVHWAYAYDRLADLVAAWERLRDLGIEPHSCLNHGFTTSFYYHDPDGNEVELAVDNFASREKMNAWFSGGAFDRNPAGYFVEPEQIAKRHRAGMPDEQVLMESYQ